MRAEYGAVGREANEKREKQASERWCRAPQKGAESSAGGRRAGKMRGWKLPGGLGRGGQAEGQDWPSAHWEAPPLSHSLDEGGGGKWGDMEKSVGCKTKSVPSSRRTRDSGRRGGRGLEGERIFPRALRQAGLEAALGEEGTLRREHDRQDLCV